LCFDTLYLSLSVLDNECWANWLKTASQQADPGYSWCDGPNDAFDPFYSVEAVTFNMTMFGVMDFHPLYLNFDGLTIFV